MEDNFEEEADPEPNIPTAFLEMENKMDFDMITDTPTDIMDLYMITDKELKKNLKRKTNLKHEGLDDWMDKICEECELSRMFHPNKGWKCKNVERMKERKLIKIGS